MGLEVWFRSILTLAVDGGEWSPSCPQPFYPQGNNFQYPLNSKLGGPYIRSRYVEKERNLLSLVELEHRNARVIATVPTMLLQLP